MPRTSPLPFPLTRFLVAAALTLACVVAALAAWLQPEPDLDDGHAREFVEAALQEIGLSDVRIASPPRSTTWAPETDSDEVFDVWVVEADVEGGHLEVNVNQESAEALWVADEATDGGPLLTEDQFLALDDYHDDPAVDDRRRRNIAASGAGVLGALVAGTLASRARRELEEAP